MGLEKQGGGWELLRADPAPPLTFPTATPGAFSCFPLGGKERVVEGTHRGCLFLPGVANTSLGTSLKKETVCPTSQGRRLVSSSSPLPAFPITY